eukprot:5213946-Prymnesium_polylepis.1
MHASRPCDHPQCPPTAPTTCRHVAHPRSPPETPARHVTTDPVPLPILPTTTRDTQTHWHPPTHTPIHDRTRTYTHTHTRTHGLTPPRPGSPHLHTRSSHPHHVAQSMIPALHPVTLCHVPQTCRVPYHYPPTASDFEKKG